jgi:hypothetical protein
MMHVWLFVGGESTSSALLERGEWLPGHDFGVLVQEELRDRAQAAIGDKRLFRPKRAVIVEGRDPLDFPDESWRAPIFGPRLMKSAMACLLAVSIHESNGSPLTNTVSMAAAYLAGGSRVKHRESRKDRSAASGQMSVGAKNFGRDGSLPRRGIARTRER